MAHTTTCYLHHGPILWRLLARLATALRATDWGVILGTLRYPLKVVVSFAECYIEWERPANRVRCTSAAAGACSRRTQRTQALTLITSRRRLWAYWMRSFGVGLALLGWRSPFDAQDNMQIQSNGGEAGRTGSDEEGRGGSGFLCQ
jgi:hypothetical protein